jgi:hypothetical protein
MATATNSRIFGVIHGSTIHAAQPNYTSAGITGRLYVANQQAQSFYPSLADTQWINGLDESRFTWYIAYLVTNDEGTPQLHTKIGTQTTPPPQDAEALVAVGEENNAYIRFKGGDTNDAFIAAIQDIKAQNEAAGNVLNNGAFPTSGATAEEWKNWADANLDYYSNFVYAVATTTTTEAPAPTYAGSIWQITNEGDTNMEYSYYPLSQPNINAPLAASASSPLGAGQSRNICSLASSETSADVTPFASTSIMTAIESGEACNGGDTSY